MAEFALLSKKRIKSTYSKIMRGFQATQSTTHPYAFDGIGAHA